jgi:hypothetical protein
MKPLVIVAGYTRSIHVNTLRTMFPSEHYTLGSTFERDPVSEIKKNYLRQFDVIFDLKNTDDISRLQAETNVVCITCTQERDMMAYINTLLICKRISEEQRLKYVAVISKSTFKESLGHTHPELVPVHTVITNDTLQTLQNLSYPQVIKPDGLAGSALIKIVHTPEEFIEHHSRFSEKMMSIGATHYKKQIQIIAEEYISGPQYSVNAYINKDKCATLCPVVRVIPPGELGSKDTYSAVQYVTNELSPKQLSDLKKSIEIIVAHFQIEETSAHFDCVLHDGHWKFFEVGLRIGGHRQELYELSNNMNHFRNDIENRIGTNISIPPQIRTSGIIQKASSAEGLLNKVSYLRQLTTKDSTLIREDKVRKIGKPVAPVSDGGSTIIRFFITGDNELEVFNAGKEVFDSIHMEVEPITEQMPE